MYIEKSEPHNDYEALADKPNVESMEPDGIIWRKLSGLWRIWHVGKDMERGDVELYHALAGLLPFGLGRRNIRSVVTVHNLEFLRLRRHFSSIYNFYRRAIMLSSMRRADRIIAASECVKQDLMRYLHIDADKIDVIYGGCHRRFSEPVTEREMERVKERYNLPSRYLLVAGRHNARKNLNHIIETLPQMDSDLDIVIVGRGTAETEALVRRMKALGVENRVRLLYGVADEDMPAIYHGATAYLMLSLYEGFSTTIVEALTVGVPVIASRGSSLEEVGGPDSIYVKSGDRKALVGAIKRVVENEELRRQMVERGREYAKRFRPEVIAYNLLNCYRRIGIDIQMW
jgi:glycosyltransferase involved in cell wall biosynthesis